MSRSSDDEDDDIVVLQVCGRCQGIEKLEFDEETNMNYCEACRKLFARTDEEGFRVLLSNDDLALVALIMKKFDPQRCGFWSFKEWNEFAAVTERGSDEIENADDLKTFFEEEYDITLHESEGKGTVIFLEDLENMYGGFAYNQIDALIEDSEALENAGIMDTGVLE